MRISKARAFISGGSRIIPTVTYKNPDHDGRSI
jgi:hypothetical protein